MKRYTGFTLIELIITVAIAAIVLTIGIPSFNATIRQNRLITTTNDFAAALSLARSEAIKRGTRVTLCKSTDGTTCVTTGGYDQGWIVFVDNLAAGSGGAAGVHDNNEDIIRVYGKLSGGMTLVGNTPVINYVSYTSDGVNRLDTGAMQIGTITLCSNGQANAIKITATGRPRVDSTSIACP